MSAFVCSPEHIAFVAVEFANRFDGVHAGDFAEKMARLNVESVDYRYNETTSREELDAFVAECREAVMADRSDLSEGRLLGAVHCSLYQSCESDACMESDTYQSLLRLVDTLKAKGVESEGWSI
jgi:hypothetical protein